MSKWSSDRVGKGVTFNQMELRIFFNVNGVNWDFDTWILPKENDNLTHSEISDASFSKPYSKMLSKPCYQVCTNGDSYTFRFKIYKCVIETVALSTNSMLKRSCSSAGRSIFA